MSKTIYPKIRYVEKRKMVEKEYNVSIVPIRFNKIYDDYAGRLRAVLKLNKELEDAKTIDEINAISDKIIALNPEETLEMKFDLIESIFIANEYEMDKEWIETRADPESLNEFIAACAMKDVEVDAKKKRSSKSAGVLNYDRLISALNKYWRAITNHEFWYKMDAEMVNNAISIAMFPKEVTDWIWVKERKPFEVF